ncbi:MAG TPA: outer membrane protein assembly factor BamD [Pyrinomonadaceae bacterium]|jgi:outer membrane protein assembly factor BamD (BamD/ComL family)|nr:outer membrane protein assembly factor BamD [Pyrinomonadaceae bacterium]
MRKSILAMFALAFVFSSSAARAQSGSVAGERSAPAVKDADSEKSARHELEVARHYFHNKKAYLAAYMRMDELIAGYPEFSHLDEALYIAGMSGLYLSEGKGKQQAPKSPAEKAAEFTPEALRDKAREYLSRIVNDYPNSDFRKEAQAALAQLDGEKPKDDKKQ